MYIAQVTGIPALTASCKYRVQMRRGREVKYYTSDFAREYGRRLNESINRRLIRPADLVSDFWYTCRVDAGKPDLTGNDFGSKSSSDEKLCRKQSRAFLKNQLIEKKFLIATKNASAN